ncbi:hypothetical protein [Microbulbifer sp. 2205BS26-8]|uniref:hypothetical protein n=1 Tax=Microbulbifer sp. 2205BS26-8 TaxID=3064386 RepID=UPI0027401443|nr:hypothetical protein [Microbulbifer sp. 2205BS26-8]MDP5210913.1 hypothetical protein [Microbulbifer sp. 2205BS26-8]
MTPESGQVLTNESGVALIELDVEGQDIGSTGEIVVTYDTASTNQAPFSPLRFTIVEPALQLGYFNNGQFVPGSLEIVATVSDELVVSTGIPDQDSFSVSATVLNTGGDSVDGVTSTINVKAADSFNNPILDGTAITFKTEYGRIEGSCTTVGGDCSVNWTSQDPRKPLAYTFLDDDGNVASLRTIFNTDCSVPGVPRGVSCPASLGQPYGARSSILAYTLGQESYNDANGNGLYDTGEVFVDLPEAFLDTNEDGAFGNPNEVGSCHPDCPEVAGDEDIPVPLIENDAYDQGNGIYNGILCSDTAEAAAACSKELVHVRQQVTVLVAGETPYAGIFEGVGISARLSSDIDISRSDSGTRYFYLSDVYNGRLPLGTTIKTKSDYCVVEPEDNAVANSSAFGPSLFPITVTAPDNAERNGSGFVRIEVNVPAPGGNTGGITKTWRFRCSYDLCVNSPDDEKCQDS